MNTIQIDNNIIEMKKISERIKDDPDLRLKINNDPLSFLKSVGIEVEKEFADSVRRGLKLITTGNGAPPELNSSLKHSSGAITFEQSTSNDIKDFEFTTNACGVVLIVPECKMEEIVKGGLDLFALGAALSVALIKAAEVIPALAPLLLISAVFTVYVATWILAEIGTMVLLDQIHHLGVYLTWTWVGIFFTIYLPIPTPITP